ncbi:MAG: DUF1002 domain-containing protein [Lachnospiraceae bacterium]|nr:DUF1002 domain-containing protein [Lachnospiraceae bacterium]
MKKKLAILLSACLLGGVLAPATVMADEQTYVALGADLDAAGRSTVLSLLNVTEEELVTDTVLTVTNAEEHQHFDSYMDPSVIGTRALSSCKVVAKNEGGITVETHNITYCTPAMYENALATAGLKNAEVVVAGPFNLSGTCALVGVLKAYEAMTGETIDPEVVDVASNELVMTADVAESVGDSEKITQLIAAIKQIILSHDYETDADIDAAIQEVAGQMNIVLSAEDVVTIRDFCKKFGNLNINPEDLSSATTIYDKLKAEGIDLSDLGNSDYAEGLFGVLTRLWDQIVGFFVGLFG